MSGEGGQRPQPSGRTVSTVVDEVFSVVADVRDDALERHAQASRAGRPLRTDDVAGLRDHLRSLLQRPGSELLGLGVIVAPDVLADRRLYLEWWQRAGRADTTPLQVDLNPASTGFYDYATTEWFEVPRRSGRRHITGPYVDVHGTGDYLLTFSMPLDADGAFLGVAGADVPASWLEHQLLDELPRDVDVVVLNRSPRVVLSTSSRWHVGELVRPGDPLLSGAAQDLPDTPWRTVLRGRDDLAGPSPS
jgi:hypothetical protein